MKIWVDDVRPAPNGYIWCQSTNEALNLIVDRVETSDDIEIIHLDHDMGDTFGGDTINILNELERKSHFSEKFAASVKRITFKIHTANPVGAENLRAIIKRNNWKEERL